MQGLTAGIVLGYHGCDEAVAEALLAGSPFELSDNDYDWLGCGAYFWEADPIRGRQWADVQKLRGKLEKPAVIGAIINLGLCLDLTQQKSLDVIRTAYGGLKRLVEKNGYELPANESEYKRQLDNMVFDYLYETMPEPKFQTVRGPFFEGTPLYPNGGIASQTHIQIAVRDLSCIKGVFRVPGDQLSLD